MPAFTQSRFLNTARINRIIGTLASRLEIERPLIYLDRLNLVPAFDDELTGRFTGKILAADLVADDQEAAVYESMTLELITHTIPNLKVGQRLGQKLINRLKQLEENPTIQGENALRDWDMKLAENLLQGVRQRQNALACAMMIDALNYNRLGIQITNASWGMPANIKVTVAIAWGANPTTATPINDIFGIDQVARLTYGIEYDTVTMGTPTFRDMVKTTEYANLAWQSLGANFLTTNVAIPRNADPYNLDIAQKILKKTIVLDDAQFYVKTNDGTEVSTRVLPLGKVLLSRKQDERDDSVWDMANGIPTETTVANMIGGGPEGLNEQYGPVSYYTGRSDLNPPDVRVWAVARCFPRRHLIEATSVLTVI